MGESWAAANSRAPEAWAEESERLKRLRDRLNKFVDYLHTKRKNGLTPHYAMGVRVRDRDMAERVQFTWPRSDQHNKDQLQQMREAADTLSVQAKAVGSVSDNPFRLVAESDWSPPWQAELVDRASALSSKARVANDAVTALLEAVQIDLPDRTLPRLEALADLASVLVESHRKQTAFALDAGGLDRIDALKEAADQLKAYAAARADLSTPYAPMAWRELDGEDIARRWDDAVHTWWPKRLFAKYSIVKELRAAGAKGKPDPGHDAPVLTALRNAGEAIDRLGRSISFLAFWDAHDTDVNATLALHDLGTRARKAVSTLADDATEYAEVNGRVRALLQEGNDLLAPEAVVGRKAEEYISAFDGLQSAAKSFETRSGRNVRELFVEHGHTLGVMRDTVEAVIARKDGLQKWCAWRNRRVQAIDLGLAPLVEGVERGHVPVDEITETFEAAYCDWWSTRLFGEDEELRTWSPEEHTDAIEKFRVADETFQQLTADYIAAKLCGQIPDQANPPRHRQWSRVKTLIQQRRPRTAIRQLFEDLPEPISKLAPCMMMSPLSIAQYLPAEQSLFDVVIFDEASQLTVWDAVGAIARGRQTIVAGDPKQMPPTNFFARADDDPDDDVYYEGDMESILDELRTANVPEKTLNLHYRSRRESLIAFSNAKYYGNELVTFPAPVHPDHSVRLVKPDGFYARGQARHNVGEAKAVVQEISRRLKSDDPAERKLSIGVVTFNAEQQSLILDLLDKKRSGNPDMEWAFSEESGHEPVFVKNLENVQGDERDVILFSVTYGPDQAGHVTMNFGPLNRDGGERRLNVAMTRARSEMVVFSTLKAEDINLARTNALAVHHLKHFLEYAERGAKVLGTEVRGSVGDFETPFETAVARALQDKGWALHPQIGVSAYRIDIGIVHPDKPGVYLAGVECDGAMYHSSAYARERDKIRQSVLEGLGWTLFRVWSTDWWLDKQSALNKIDAQLRDHLRVVREADAGNGETVGDTQPQHQRAAHAVSADANTHQPPENGTEGDNTGGTQRPFDFPFDLNS